MKLNSIAILLMLSIVFGGCKKDNETSSLLLTFVDSLHNPVSGATINLKTYSNAGQWINGEVVGGDLTGEYNGISDIDGNVFFANLTGSNCIWDAKKGCMNNFYMAYSDFPKLSSGTQNSDTTVLRNMGYMALINISSTSYKVYGPYYLNGAIILPNDTLSGHFFIGPFTIRGEPENTPGIGRDTLIQINCADTVKIKFPF